MFQALRALGGLYRTRRATRTVVAMLKPLVDGEATPDGAPGDGGRPSPFRLGFLSTAIARLGRRLDPDLDGESLGQLQLEVWGALTGAPADLVGEQILALSLGQDADFLAGCAAALAFADALLESRADSRDGGADLDELWRRYARP